MNVAKDFIGDHGLVASVEEVFAFGKPQTEAETATKAVQVITPAEVIPSKPHEITAQVLSESPRPPALPKILPQGKELKTAAELAAMIEFDLAQHPESPKKGLRVTVYGATDWRAMLTIMPAAGRVRDPQQLRDLTDQFAERLRQRFDLAWE
jgi:hypothetical protein